MKFDKELLLKHKFWIVFGTGLLTLIIAFFIVWTNASGDVDDAKKKYLGATTQLKDFTSNLSNVVNVSTFLSPWNAYETKFRNHKDAIWHVAWNGQKSLITWPHEVESDAEDKRTELDDVWNACDKFKDWKEKMSSDVPGSNIRERYKEALYFAVREESRGHQRRPGAEQANQAAPEAREPVREGEAGAGHAGRSRGDPRRHKRV